MAMTEKDVLLRLPDARLHLVDRGRSHPLAAGDLSLVRVRSSRGDASLAAAVAILHQVKWPLAPDVAAVKLDAVHYSFTLLAPDDGGDRDGPVLPLHYGLTLARPDPRLDAVLAAHTDFSIRPVAGGEAEADAAAYWTAVAPEVEDDYGATVARAIASGAGSLAKGILWCGEVTTERIRRGHQVIQERMEPGGADAEVSPEMMRRITRAKKVTEITEKVATGILSGVVEVTGCFTGAVTNTKAAKKILSLVPGEIVLASLDGFGKISDAVEVAGKNVLSTSSTVTTELVSYKYGGKAAAATNEGLDAAGHAIRAGWAVFKIRQAWNSKSARKSTAKSMFNNSRAKSRL